MRFTNPSKARPTTILFMGVGSAFHPVQSARRAPTRKTVEKPLEEEDSEESEGTLRSLEDSWERPSAA